MTDESGEGRTPPVMIRDPQPEPDPAILGEWRLVRLAHHEHNDPVHHLVQHVDHAKDQSRVDPMTLVTEDGETLFLDLHKGRLPTPGTIGHVEHPNVPKTVSGTVSLPPLLDRAIGNRLAYRSLHRAILASGIAHELAPGRTIRMRVDARNQVSAIGPFEILVHPNELDVARACGTDIDAVHAWVRSITNWPAYTDRTLRRVRSMRLIPYRRRERITYQTNDGALSYHHGMITLRGVELPDTIRLEAPGLPLRDIVSIPAIDHLPIMVHAILDADLGGTQIGICIDYAPASECVNILA